MNFLIFGYTCQKLSKSNTILCRSPRQHLETHSIGSPLLGQQFPEIDGLGCRRNTKLAKTNNYQFLTTQQFTPNLTLRASGPFGAVCPSQLPIGPACFRITRTLCRSGNRRPFQHLFQQRGAPLPAPSSQYGVTII